jgi:hypothetical protein
MGMTDSVRYVAKCEVSTREEEGGTLLYDPDADEVTIVNAAGAELWAALAEPRTVDELAGRLVEAFSGVDLEQARTDVEAFLEEIPDSFVSAV